MTTYEVEFKFETSTIVEVEAKSEAEARDLAYTQMRNMSVDHLPEMWPSDYVLESVEVVE